MTEHEKSPLAQAVGKMAAAKRRQHKGSPVSVREGLLEEGQDDYVRAKLLQAIDKALDPPEPYRPLLPAYRRELAMRLLGDDGLI